MNRAFAIAAALVVAAVAAAPVYADPPVQTEEPIFGVFADLENRRFAFWNITRADFCAWQAAGFAAPPPVIELVPASMHETGQGAVVTSYRATRPIELWALDSDAAIEDPCSDTDDQPAPWGTGTIHVTYTDNDFFASMTRTNVWGDRGQGTVFDAEGAAWHYSWTTRLQLDQEGQFRVLVDNFNLKKKGR